MTLGSLRRRSGRPAPAGLQALRDQMAKMLLRELPIYAEVSPSRADIGGVPALVMRTPGARRTLVYFHGGGFRIGCPEISAEFVMQVAAAAQLNVVMPYYSLAPEHPFPSALLEGDAVLRALADRGEILLGGDSAGGNLATVLALEHSDTTRGLLLISPWLDLRNEAQSFLYNANDPVFSKAAADAAAALYLDGHAATDPMASPLLADLSALPATLLVGGSGEVLLDDAVAFTHSAAKAGRSVSLHTIAAMTHVEPVTRSTSPLAADVMRLCVSFCVDTGSGPFS